MSKGIVERDGLLWVPVLPREFVERVFASGLDLKRKEDWPEALRDEYNGLRAQFTRAKAEFTSWLRKDRDSRMTRTAKTVASTMLECLNFDTGRCDPSHQFIADELGISRRQVERIVPQIASSGWISIKRRGCKETNAYTFRVTAQKVSAILDYADHLRELRQEERERRKNSRFMTSDPTPMSDQSQSDPTSMRSPDPTPMSVLDPTPMSVLDPTPMSDKPLKGTSEGEHLKKAQCAEGEGYTLHPLAHDELPYEAPATLEESRRFLARLGVPSHRMETAMQRHMRETLFPRDIADWRQEARDGRTA